MTEKEGEIPERIKKRIELSKMFYPLDRNEERKWGRLCGKGFEHILLKLQEVAEEKNYLQEEAMHQVVLWRDKDDSNVECMFCFIPDAGDLNSVSRIFATIRALQPVFTYAIVHQRKDGEGQYDIFRFSRFSYLEHCNRVRSPKKKRSKSENKL
jgi:hypothetical protein